jgi:hypothetical protein
MWTLLFTSVQFWLRSSVAVLLVLAMQPAYGSVRIERDSNGYVTIYITDTITKHDGEEFKSVMQELSHQSLLMVTLNSSGGDVDAAMLIGRLIRKLYGRTDIRLHEKCYSSCALIFIAGVMRINLGELGLHRPFFATTPLSREQIESQVPILLDKLKKYIIEMGITDNFYQILVNTEPSDIVIYGLTNGNLDDFAKLVPTVDPTYDEITVAESARLYGITTLEVRQRSKEADRECSVTRLPDTYINCRSAITWGLSESVYLERNVEAVKDCRYSDDEKKILHRTPRVSSWDLPLVIRHEDCVRSIMLGKD